jgi:hypothetical protein
MMADSTTGPAKRPATEHDRRRVNRLYAIYRRGFIVADFLAAWAFVIGSVLFFYASTVTLGTWFFVVGSLFFAAKPSLRVASDIHLARITRELEEEVDALVKRKGFH